MNGICLNGLKVRTVGKQTIHGLCIILFGDQNYAFSFVLFQYYGGRLQVFNDLNLLIILSYALVIEV